MIPYQQHTLANGLRILVHEDPSSPMAAVNILYDVGARDENPQRTGFAHLFEHLMFGGTAAVPEFDTVLQQAGGNNNAYTTNDLTNYYDVLPAANLETAFWLEADRMNLLDFSERSLDVQRKVVCEEFKEHYINQPYGDVWHKLRALTYTVHPYRWPTIGLELAHVEQATLEDVQAFFFRYYRPNNAILAVSGGVQAAEVFALAEKWFGPIEAGLSNLRNLPVEPEQTAARHLAVEADVPVDVLYRAWPMCGRNHADYHATDLLSDLLSAGESGRLHRRLVMENELFAELEAYVTGSLDQGLFVVEGKYAEGVDRAEAESALEAELERMRSELVSETELEKARNQSEAHEAFGNISVLGKAMKLAYFEWLGDAAMVNQEVEKYRRVTAQDIRRVAAEILRPERCNTLHYLARQAVLS
jgi:zinc protease